MSKKSQMLEQAMKNITVKSGRKATSLFPLVVYLEHFMLENGLSETPGLVRDIFHCVLLRLENRPECTTTNKKGDWKL